MTQPIQEPSNDRSLQGFAYSRDQIFRRPAPSGGATEISFSWMHWDNGTVTVPSGGSWKNFQDIDAFDYGSGFDSDPNTFGVNADLVNGWIQWDRPLGDDVLVHINAWTWISDTGWSVGDVLGVAINIGDDGTFSNNLRWIDTVTVGDVNDDFMEDQRLTVSAVVHSEYPDYNTARVQVYQSSGADKSFADCGLTVTALRLATGFAV